jgi:hypothetical protein
VIVLGTVPQGYYDFVMHYAPYFYVITTALAQDAPSGRKNVTVANGTKFQLHTCETLPLAGTEFIEMPAVMVKYNPFAARTIRHRKRLSVRIESCSSKA